MYAMADDRINADRGRAIEAALANIEKRFGKGSIMRLGEREVSDIPGNLDYLAESRRSSWRWWGATRPDC